MTATEDRVPARHFLQQAIEEDIAYGRFGGRVVTRFPPEPNGYLHIGHAKSICLNFELAEEFGGVCNLRFDDTNPAKEEQRFVDSMMEDIRWLGFDWGDRLYFASDCFEQMYEYALQLARDGKAYVCELNAEQIREYRGTLTEPGRNSPWRDRPIEESVDLLGRMRAGQFPDGSKTLRAKIDMASPNLNLRDPVMYRILRAPHHRTGTAWSIYPTYDWAHGLEDSIEGVTHSICTLEFEDHRPLYDWFLEQLGVHHPRQIEFARFNLTHTITAKRKLRLLVDERHVDGWDDPRMPTVAGLRRRGFPPSAIRKLFRAVGVSRVNSRIDMGRLEECVRDELNQTAPRAMAVLDPVRLVIESWPEGEVDELEAVNNPEDASAGTRTVPFGRELYIEREDFMLDPPKKFFRLAPGREVRLRYGYFVTCTDVVTDEAGEIIEIRCTHDPATRGGDSPDGRKVKGTLHWVSAAHAVAAEVRLYDRLFTEAVPDDPKSGVDFVEHLNPASLVVVRGMLEPSLAQLEPGGVVQFERKGYFRADDASMPAAPIFNRVVGLRDSWAKIAGGQGR